MKLDSTQRFSNRVADYVKFRPGYPPGFLPLLEREIGLAPHWAVADIGAGTGISAEMFLKNGNEVWAVEPNMEMRAAASQMLGGFPRFHALSGTAEATGLSDGSVDLVTAFQAFHWFDPAGAKQEFRRILRPGTKEGHSIVLVWNERKKDGSPFLTAYEQLLHDYASDYGQTRHAAVTDDMIADFFAPAKHCIDTLSNEQTFDYAGIKGRLMSSSYAPVQGQPGHDEMIAELRRMFDRHQVGGKVQLIYETRIHYGK